MRTCGVAQKNSDHLTVVMEILVRMAVMFAISCHECPGRHGHQDVLAIIVLVVPSPSTSDWTWTRHPTKHAYTTATGDNDAVILDSIRDTKPTSSCQVDEQCTSIMDQRRTTQQIHENCVMVCRLTRVQHTAHPDWNSRAGSVSLQQITKRNWPV